MRHIITDPNAYSIPFNFVKLNSIATTSLTFCRCSFVITTLFNCHAMKMKKLMMKMMISAALFGRRQFCIVVSGTINGPLAHTNYQVGAKIAVAVAAAATAASVTTGRRDNARKQIENFTKYKLATISRDRN